MDPNEPPEIPEELREQLQGKADALEAAAHKMGLHAQQMTVGAAIDPRTGEPGRLVLMTSFVIGDLAFTDRVQDPVANAVDDELAKIEHDFTIEKIMELRSRMKGEETDGTDLPDS